MQAPIGGSADRWAGRPWRTDRTLLASWGRVWELVTKRASQLPASSTRVAERAPNPPPPSQLCWGVCFVEWNRPTACCCCCCCRWNRLILSLVALSLSLQASQFCPSKRPRLLLLYIYIYNTTASIGPSNPPPPPAAARSPQGGGVVNVPRTGAPASGVSINETARPFGLLLSVLPCLPASSCISLRRDREEEEAREASLTYGRRPWGRRRRRTTPPRRYRYHRLPPSVHLGLVSCFAGQPWRPARFST